MFTPPKPSKSPKIKTATYNNWLKGVVTAFDAGRMPYEALLTAENVMLDQDGTVRPRYSLAKYGPPLLGSVQGEIYEFKKQVSNGSEFYMCCLQRVSGETGFYVAAGEDAVWRRIGTKAYDSTARANFFQLDNKVMVLNGEDRLSYYDIITDNIVTYTQLSTPAAPTHSSTSADLTGTGFKVYYAVTANSTVGETNSSGHLSRDVKKDRNVWDNSKDSLVINWAAIPDAQSYNVYVGVAADGAGEPSLYRIASGLDASLTTFSDTGVYPQDLMSPIPAKNGTAGPRARRGTEISGRAWLVGDKDNPFYIWRGGDAGHELDFSPSYGGGYTPVGSGTKEVPVHIKGFRDGQGTPKITVLTQNSNGMGMRYFLSSREIEYRNVMNIVWEITPDTGSDGTDSPDGIVVYNNSLFYPSKDGFKTTGTKPQLQNVLSTDRVSNTIQDQVSRLNTESMDKAVGVAWEGAIYWALPVGDDKNNEVWILDLDREGAWMKPLNIKADWMWLYNDNSGRTHFLILKDDEIYEFDKLARTSDNGNGFVTALASGHIKFSESGRDWARVTKVAFRLSRPRGQINLSVTGYTEDGVSTWGHDEFYKVESSVAGWGEPSAMGLEGFGLHGWGLAETPPTATGAATRDIEIEIDEDLMWFTFGLTSHGVGVNYQLSMVSPEFVFIGPKDI